MNVFIIEGPDGAGKTTLINAIKAADSSIETVHPGKPPESYEALLAMLNDQLNFKSDAETRIYDRASCISENVYRPFRVPLQKNPGNETAVYFSLLEAQLALSLNLDWTIIYCRPADETILEQCLQFTEHDTDETKRVVETHIKDVIATYDAQMVRLEQFGCRVVRFNYELHNMDEFIKAVIGR